MPTAYPTTGRLAPSKAPTGTVTKIKGIKAKTLVELAKQKKKKSVNHPVLGRR